MVGVEGSVGSSDVEKTLLADTSYAVLGAIVIEVAIR